MNTPKRERCTATLMGADGNVHECEYPLDAHEWHRIKSVRWTDSAPGATPHRPSIEWIDRQISEQWAPALKRMAEGATPHRPAEPPSGHQPLTAAEMAQAKQIAEEILAEEILAEDEPSREACSAALPVVQSLRIALSDASVSTIKARAEIARALDAFAKQAVEAERTGIAQDLVALDRAGGLKLTSAIDAIIARGNK